jgi:hypothetical protein
MMVLFRRAFTCAVRMCSVQLLFWVFGRVGGLGMLRVQFVSIWLYSWMSLSTMLSKLNSVCALW